MITIMYMFRPIFGFGSSLDVKNNVNLLNCPIACLLVYLMTDEVGAETKKRQILHE